MVKHIIYKEVKYPIRIGFTTLCKLKEVHGKGFSNMGADDIEMFETLALYGVLSGLKAVGDDKTEFTKEMAIDYLEDNMFEFGLLVPEFFPKEEKAKEGKGKFPMV